MRWRLLVFIASMAVLTARLAQAEVLDDPMRPPGYPRAGSGSNIKLKPGWNLSAIRIDAVQRIAIINGQMLEVGGWVNNARVVEILPEQVRLDGRQGLFSVQLVKMKIRKSPVLPADR